MAKRLSFGMFLKRSQSGFKQVLKLLMPQFPLIRVVMLLCHGHV
jgi:hypothetical protein